ncbi:uncharacterized protein with TBP-like fold DUF4468 [Sphingobacterium allocomposti]|uniref:Uncharacterized protein with TBP-like fold DUF4468 n=1 Tax=Sphingobacterium allocomposti TaxID=415956 RepID=A0A5S5D0B8_9SPHI|nr:DUF4468 domain-containing protein [Sphingobacterium composti Yoo et al. 2007 non Ten et al. 2007]TYP89471.1 uncharacterized protein with TBP-like fold DUF4468 [Sphingobacterium composti Yoo et al. 2007 non Ten et al. 2007]
MKSILLLLLTIPILGVSQDLPQVDGKVVYSIDVYNDHADKMEMFSLCKSFIDEVLKPENVILHTEDFTSGQIIGKGVSAFDNESKKGFNWAVGAATRPTFTLQFDVYDNKATLTIKEIVLAKLNVMDEVLRPMGHAIEKEFKVSRKSNLDKNW